MRDFMSRAATVLRLAVNDFKQGYAGSALGALWAVAEPLVTVAVYWFVYTVAFGGSEVGGVPYYIWLSAGIAPWFFISNGINGVTVCFRDYAFLVKKMRFDKACLPIIRTVSSLISHMIFTLLVILVCLISGTGVISPLYLIAAVFISSVFVYAVGRISALLCARFKDIKNITSVALSVGFWLTPVFWNIQDAPEDISRLVRLNPAADIVELYRAAILGTECADMKSAVYITAVCAVLLLLGGLYEKSALPTVADRL